MVTAFDGFEDIEKSQSFCPDLVICDVNMPVMNGSEVYERFQQLEALRDAIFIVKRLVELQGGQDNGHCYAAREVIRAPDGGANVVPCPCGAVTMNDVVGKSTCSRPSSGKRGPLIPSEAGSRPGRLMLGGAPIIPGVHGSTNGA